MNRRLLHALMFAPVAGIKGSTVYHEEHMQRVQSDGLGNTLEEKSDGKGKYTQNNKGVITDQENELNESHKATSDKKVIAEGSTQTVTAMKNSIAAGIENVVKMDQQLDTYQAKSGDIKRVLKHNYNEGALYMTAKGTPIKVTKDDTTSEARYKIEHDDRKGDNMATTNKAYQDESERDQTNKRKAEALEE